MPKPQERKKITHMHMCTNTHTCKYLTNKAGVFRLVHCYCHLLVPLVQMKYSDSVHIQILMFWQDFFNLRGFLEDEVRAISVAKPQIHIFLSLTHTHCTPPPAFTAAAHVCQMECRAGLHPPLSWVSPACDVGSSRFTSC